MDVTPNIVFCCDQMKNNLNCPSGSDRIFVIETNSEYFFSDGKKISEPVAFCPWCGSLAEHFEINEGDGFIPETWEEALTPYVRRLTDEVYGSFYYVEDSLELFTTPRRLKDFMEIASWYERLTGRAHMMGEVSWQEEASISDGRVPGKTVEWFRNRDSIY